MKNLMLLLFFVQMLVGLSATEYDWPWAKQAGGANNDEGYAIALDADGNSYISGCFSVTATFGTTTLTGSGGKDIFVAKLDPNGNWLWAKQAGGTINDTGYAIAVDATGNSYVSGCFAGTVTFGTIHLTSNGDGDVFVAKLDPDGNWLWAKQAGGNYFDEGYAIAVDAEGNSYICGYFMVTATFGTTTLTSSGESDIFVAKLDTNGNWLWVKQASGLHNDEARAIAVDAAGNSYVSGYFNNTAMFGTTNLIGNGISDIFVAKLDPNGNWLWARQAGGIYFAESYAIAVDTAGNSYLSGYFLETATFGTIHLTSNGDDDDDIFVAKLDTNGNWLWAKSAVGMSKEIAYAIAVDAEGNSFVSGIFFSTTTFGSTSLTSSGWADIFIAKLDTNGNFLWATQAGGISHDVGHAIAVDAEGNSYICGYFAYAATFGTTILTSSGGSDIFIAKLSPDGVFVSDELISPAASISHLGNAYPNPFRQGSSGTIKADVPDHETGVFTIYNLRGQVLQSHSLSAGAHEISVSTADLIPGIYFYRLKTPSLCEVKILLVLK